MLAHASYAVVLADAGPAVILALASFAVVLADARPAAWLALAPFAVVLAYTRPAAILALASLAVVWTLCGLALSCCSFSSCNYYLQPRSRYLSLCLRRSAACQILFSTASSCHLRPFLLFPLIHLLVYQSSSSLFFF